MSSRALRRLQKQQEEQKALERAEEEKSEEEVLPAKAKQSAFALLNETEEDDHDDLEVDEPVEQKTATFAATQKSIEPEQPQPKSSKKKKKKKKSNAAGPSNATKDSDGDDIDALLASVAQSTREESRLGALASGKGPDGNQLQQLLSVDPQNLHAINEMRRLFGRDAIDERPRQPQRAPRQRGQRIQQEGRGFPPVSLKRNVFVQGKEEWPRATTGGLGMEILSKDDSSGTTEFRFVHSTSYQDTQRQYEIAVASMDPQRLVVLLQHNPYHIATLLQVSEIMKHDRMHTEAGDVLERALFAFGRTVHSTFPNAVAAGKARLSFNRPENREFFLACWKYIQDLSMRSTWRTVYEWAKLLLSLEPELDPYCLGLVMDQYALRANQAEHYLKLHGTGIFKSQTDFWWDVQYSVALCHLRLSHYEEARSVLQKAIERDRYTAHQLCKALEIGPIPAPLWAHHEPPDARTALFSEMYTTRGKDLWNTSEAKSLLESVAKEAPKESPLASSTMQAISVEAARHVYLTENDAFMRLLAQCQLEPNAEPGDKPTQDPFPPHSDIITYDSRPAGGRGGVAPGITALGRVPNAQMRVLMEELARMQMGGERGEDGEHDQDQDDDGFDDDFGEQWR